MGRASGAMPISAARMRSGAWLRHPSSRSSRGAGAFRSRAASPTSASSTRTTRTRAPTGSRCRATTSASAGWRPIRRSVTCPIRSSTRCWPGASRGCSARSSTSSRTSSSTSPTTPSSTRRMRAWSPRRVYAAGMRRALPSPELAEWERQEAREREFAALLAAARARLERLYASDAPAEAMRIAKDREFGRLKFEYATAARALGRLRRLRRVVRPRAQQRASRGGRDLRGLRAGAHPRARGGAVAAGVLRPCGRARAAPAQPSATPWCAREPSGSGSRASHCRGGSAARRPRLAPSVAR